MIGLPFKSLDTEEDKPSMDPETEKEFQELAETLKAAITKTSEGDEQNALVEAIQLNRNLLLNQAFGAYLKNPRQSKLLESVISILAGLEKSVRDDRKEAAKKKELETNTVAFNDMLEALKDISAGKIEIPTFDMSEFVLDPSKSLTEVAPDDYDPISEEELVQGNVLVDIEGNPID